MTCRALASSAAAILSADFETVMRAFLRSLADLKAEFADEEALFARAWADPQSGTGKSLQFTVPGQAVVAELP